VHVLDVLAVRDDGEARDPGGVEAGRFSSAQLRLSLVEGVLTL
jgi:hypothetical protein